MNRSLIARAAVSDRGESAMAVLIGSLLFLLASAGVASFLIMAMGATALAQSNEMRTGALSAEVQQFERTAWSELSARPVEETTLTADGRTFPSWSTVTYNATLRTYTFTITAPRAVRPGEPLADCEPALTARTAGCIALSGYVTATADDVAPELPDGVTLTTRQVAGAGGSANVLTNPGFEQQLTAWTVDGDVTTLTRPARSTGSVTAQITGVGEIRSEPIRARAGDVHRFDVWVQPAAGDGDVRLLMYATAGDDDSAVVVDTAAAGAGWQLLRGQVTVPAGVNEISLAIATTSSCSDACRWLVDDAAAVLIQGNTVADPGFDGLEDGWTVEGEAAIIADADPRHPLSAGVAELSGAGTVRSTPFATISGQYIVEVWLRAQLPEVEPEADENDDVTDPDSGETDGDSVEAAGGTVQVAVNVDGVLVPVGAADVDDISNWTRIAASVTVPAGTNVTLAVSGELTGGATVLVDDAIVRSQAAAGAEQGGGHLVLADIDPSKFAGYGHLRVSFEYLSDRALQNDVVAGVYCVTSAGVVTLSETRMAVTDSDEFANRWLWARVGASDLDRLVGCATAEMRVSSPTTSFDPNDLGTISILRVL